MLSTSFSSRWSKWWIERDTCKRGLTKCCHCKPACQRRADKEKDSDGLLCLFGFSLLSPLILFNFPLLFICTSLLFLILVFQSHFLFYSISCQVADLKFELKLRSLPVYGTKNDLIERLRTYEELSGGSDTTSSPTAGGTTVPGAEGAGKSSSTAAAINNTTSQRQQTSSLKRHSGYWSTSRSPVEIVYYLVCN